MSRALPDDPLGFIRRCVERRKVLWTYHVNMRLEARFISREAILESSAAFLPAECRRMERESEGQEVAPVKCHVCGSELVPAVTDLPFKRTETTIVIVKNLPILQCEGCSEYLLEDAVMARVEEILKKVDSQAELEVVRYAA